MTGRQVAVGYFLWSLTVSALAGLAATEVLPFHGVTFTGSWLIDFALIMAAHAAAAPYIGPRLERWLTRDDEDRDGRDD